MGEFNGLVFTRRARFDEVVGYSLSHFVTVPSYRDFVSEGAFLIEEGGCAADGRSKKPNSFSKLKVSDKSLYLNTKNCPVFINRAVLLLI